MKKSILLFLTLFGYVSFAQNTVNIASESVAVDTGFSLAIDIENTDAIAAFQFDITYSGNAIDLGSGHSLTARASTHIISASNIDDNTIRVLAYSTNNTTIASGTGTVLNLNLVSKNEPGTYAMQISDIVLSDANGAALTNSGTNGQVIVLGPKYTLTTTSINLGNVPMQSSTSQNITISNSGNASMDVTSYTLAAPFSISTPFPVTIAAGASASFVVEVDTSVKQNVTKSAAFTTTDTSSLRAVQSTVISANVYAVNEIHIGAGAGNINTAVTIPVSINNMETFNGFQLDITLPADISYVANSVVFSGRETDHAIAASMLDSNTLRVIAYSSTNANFTTNSGEVFSFDLIPNVSSGTYSLATSEEIISNSAFGNVESDSFAGSITINAPNLYISSADATLNLGRIPITEDVLREITLKNSGNADLVIDEVVYNSATLSSTISTPLTLTSNESTDKTITFSPTTVGTFSSSISIRHNGATEQNVVQVTADVFSPNYLYIEENTVFRDESHIIRLGLSNNDPIRAVQFDINIPDGFVLDRDNITSLTALTGFNMSSSDLGNGNYRFVIYTLSSNVIAAGTNPLLDLPITVSNNIAYGDYNFDFSGVVLSNTSNQNTASEALTEGDIHVVEGLILDTSSPAAVASNVALDASITLNFNVAASIASVNANNIRITGKNTGIIAGTFSGVGTSTVVFTPTNDFKHGEEVTVTLTSGLQHNTSNTDIRNPQSFRFSTKSSLPYFSPTFTATEITTAANGAISVFAADLDNDGDIDLVSSSQDDNKIAWYENDGAETPTFTTSTIAVSAEGAWSVYAADMDNDGDMDIVSASKTDNTIAWYENDGTANPSWVAADIDTNATGARSVYIADLDNDGDMDIVSASYNDNTIAWYENDGAENPTWSGVNIDITASGATSVFASDLDNDGDLDILASSANNNTIAWYENDGGVNPTWTASVIATSADVPILIFASDMDNDGDVDIISASKTDNTIAWYENDGAVNPSWTAADIATNAENARAIFLADMDNDGDMDILSASQDDDTIAWYENDGAANPSWTAADIVTNIDGANFVFAADLDKDGDMDIVSTAINDDSVTWFKNSSVTTWNGSTSIAWENSDNWSNGIPTLNSDISVPAGLTNYPTVTAAVGVKSVNLASGTSLIAQNTFAGNITYTRSLATDNWYLVSSPVAGETLEDFIVNNNFVNGTPPNIGLAPYVNDGTAWDYQTAATTGSIASGTGYSVKLASAGDLTFTGSLPVTDVDIAISTNTNGFNLVGNPYPSYIAGNTSADGTHNLISVNTSSLTEATIWLWNEATNSYDTFNLASSSLFISPAQGFFVSSNGSNTFSFTEAMQSHQSDSFQRTTNNRPEINLMLSNGNDTTDTDIFYIEGTTTGWDNGYDSTIFGGTSNSFSVYTHLVSDSEGQNLSIQSLPDTDLESMIIPVGINAVSGTEITISVATQNLPDGIDVYLEDKEEDSFTLLESDSNYTTTLTEALNGIGRYYLYTSAQVLSTNDLMTENISIYMTNNNTLRVIGVQNVVAQVKVYSMLGKQVQVTSFQGNGINEVLLPKVAKGVYIIQLETRAGTLHKKVIIE
ncbi:FG-GAP-like repeat-containing protein [Polaribacter sp.]|nr:FG-GAP-like repeat-containing protein [Polaribacter sp.]